MSIKIGDKLPEATFTQMTEDGPTPISTADLCAGKTVAIFAVPGAFTPTCSAKHLPNFKDRLGDLQAQGVDQVACVSVNDVFVMGAWGEAEEAGDILMLADGNGDFTEAVGLTLDASGFGMGKRSQRYAMLVKDGKVVQLNVDEGGDYKVSSADYMLDNI